jgi:hypothetical protein
MRRDLQPGTARPRAALAITGILTAAFAGATGAARADNSDPCPSSTQAPYTMKLKALTGPNGADLTLGISAAAGCAVPEVLKKVQLKTFGADGSQTGTRNLPDVAAPGGVAKDIDLGNVPRGRKIEADVLIQTGTPKRTYEVRGTTQTLLRPDLVILEINPQQALVGKPVAVKVVIAERNGDVDATAAVSMSAIPGATEQVRVPAGGQATVTFADVTFGTPIPVEVTVKVESAEPVETDVANNTRTEPIDVTEHQLSVPRNVLFPSLVGYGAQFGMHLYAPVTPWPAGVGYGNVEDKVRKLEPQLVRIFYNDNWDGNANGKFPDWQTNYASFVKVVRLAQESGATIDITFQNLGNARVAPEPAMTKFADVLEELIRQDGLTNVRWAEVGNEPNDPNGTVTLDEYNTLVRALHAQLVARGLREHIHLMGGGLVESVPTKSHYIWMKWIAQNMGDVVDAYAEHVYWFYDRPGRLEYRLRDVYNLMKNELPAEQQKPQYMMEFGIRGFNACGTKPAFGNLYYLDGNCTEIWRTNIAAFQQLWFNIDSAQLGVAGTSKWDAFWSRYDNSSVTNQLYWMIGPPAEGSPLTPTYYAMSMLFHVTAPGWQIVRVEPWESNDSTVPAYGGTGLITSDDQPEKELVGYAGPNGELSIVGLDTNGRALNAVSPDPPPKYSIGGLPPNTGFTLAVWNATGDGANTIAGKITTNAAGVARFEVPLQAAFALTTVPVS